MSVTTVIELSHELRRLAVAGTALATGDRRVAALLPALEASGAKVPVFAKIAERANALLGASKADAPAEFLQLNTLVGAVLKTQGKAGVDGELVPLPPSTTSAKRIPMRALTELHEVCGRWQGGRTRVLDDAVERGWFGDARLAPFALEALGADDAALANLAARTLVPAYGRAIVPQLVASLDLSSRRPAARVIEAVGRVDADGGAALARQILDPASARTFALEVDGERVSDEATVAALGLLGDEAADRGLLADALDAKRKAIRIAALSRSLALGDAEAEERAATMLGGSAAKAREAIEAIPRLSGAAMAAPVIDRARALASLPVARSKAMETADVKDAVRLLSLFARSPMDAERFDAAFALFARVAAEGAAASELRDDGISALLGTLVAACPAKRRKALARTTMPFSAARTAHAALLAVGPDETLAFLQLGRKDDFLAALQALSRGVVVERSGEAFELPPPAAWGAEWLALALRHDLVDLIDYLRSLDPGAVVASVLAPRKVRDAGLAVVALTTDPGCADALRRKLDPRIDGHEGLDALCAAIVDGERARALELAAEGVGRQGRYRAVTLRSRLAAHFSGTRA